MTHKIEVTIGFQGESFENAQWRIRSDGNLEIYITEGDAQTNLAVFKNWDSVRRYEVEEPKVVEENYATEYEEPVVEKTPAPKTGRKAK